MTDGQKIILIALGVLFALCVIVGATLNHHIGGFLETVAREEEERQADKDKAAQADDTGE